MNSVIENEFDLSLSNGNQKFSRFKFCRFETIETKILSIPYQLENEIPIFFQN